MLIAMGTRQVDNEIEVVLRVRAARTHHTDSTCLTRKHNRVRGSFRCEPLLLLSIDIRDQRA